MCLVQAVILKDSLACRYLLAESEETLYVAFIGTKQGRDIMTNANIMQQPLWPDLPDAMPAAGPQVSSLAHLCKARALSASVTV